MHWLLLILINVIAISVSSLFMRLAMRRQESDPLLATIFQQLFLGLVVFGFVLTQGFVWPDWQAHWPNLLFSSVFYGLGALSFFKSIKLIEASQMTILGAAGSVITMLGAYVLLGERLDGWQYLGAALVLGAVLLTASRGGRLVFDHGVRWALLGTSLFAIAVINDTWVIRSYDALSFAALMSTMPGIFLCLLFWRRLPQLLPMLRQLDRNLLSYTGLYAVGVITFYAALGTGALVSQVSVVGRSNIILTVLLAAIFIGERQHFWRKVAAAILCTAGVLLIA